MSKNIFIEVYRLLLETYGPQGWWPVTPEGEITPAYIGGPKDRRGIFEVAVGAVLTQNTSWKNVSKAIEELNKAGAMAPEKILGMPMHTLASLIRSSGYYNQKAKRLKALARYFIETGYRATRDSLLEIHGIGPETADSIMLYGYGELHFVIDAYTRRVFSRLGVVEEDLTYESLQSIFEENIPADANIYKEFHALIVEHSKHHCKKRPECSGCILKRLCKWYKLNRNK